MANSCWMKVQERFVTFENGDQMLKVIKFEDLVSQYDNTVDEIFSFLKRNFLFLKNQ